MVPLDMNVLIRVDASAKIGTGHIMRCLTLAQALRQAGSYTRFICRHIPEALAEMLQSMGHDVVRLEATDNVLQVSDLQHSDWLGVSQNFDALETKKLTSDLIWDWIIVDHYALDCHWESAVKADRTKIFVIDDLADRRHDCDIFFNQNIVECAEFLYADKLPSGITRLIGPEYSLLRDEFLSVREHALVRKAPIRNILVFFGGFDASNATGKTLAALSLIGDISLNVVVVVGAQHPCLSAIQDTCTEQGYTCHVQTSEMAKLMAQADLSIGAGGSASWERCSLGLPSLIISVAENQVPIARAVDEAGLAVYLGKDSAIDGAGIVRAVRELAADPQRLEQMSARCFALADGHGKRRVVELMYDQS